VEKKMRQREAVNRRVTGHGRTLEKLATADGRPRVCRFLTWADASLFCTMVGTGVALMLLPLARAETVEALHVEVGGALLTSTVLGGTDTLKIRGPIGETTVLIEDGRARVLSAPCRQQICVRAGSISRSGEMIVCVPNEIIVSVAGGGGERPASGGVDAVTR
jgi:hypothetical protein